MLQFDILIWQMIFSSPLCLDEYSIPIDQLNQTCPNANDNSHWFSLKLKTMYTLVAQCPMLFPFSPGGFRCLKTDNHFWWHFRLKSCEIPSPGAGCFSVFPQGIRSGHDSRRDTNLHGTRDSGRPTAGLGAQWWPCLWLWKAIAKNSLHHGLWMFMVGRCR